MPLPLVARHPPQARRSKRFRFFPFVCFLLSWLGTVWLGTLLPPQRCGCRLARSDHLRDAHAFVGRSGKCQTAVGGDQSLNVRHAVGVAHGVLRHRPPPPINLHNLWLAPGSEHIPQFGEHQRQEPLIAKQRGFGIEGTSHERPHQHRAGRGAAWKLLA